MVESRHEAGRHGPGVIAKCLCPYLNVGGIERKKANWIWDSNVINLHVHHSPTKKLGHSNDFMADSGMAISTQRDVIE